MFLLAVQTLENQFGYEVNTPKLDKQRAILANSSGSSETYEYKKVNGCLALLKIIRQMEALYPSSLF